MGKTTSKAAGTSRARRQAKPAPIDPVAIPPDEIALEAYSIYTARQGRDGDALSDWLEAERRVRERRESGPPAAADRTRSTDR